MHPVTTMTASGRLWYVSQISVTGEISLELVLKKFCGMVSHTGLFILKKNNSRRTTEFVCEINPHPVRGGAFLIRLINNLHPRFFPVHKSALEEFLFHESVNRLKYQSVHRTIQSAIILWKGSNRNR